MNVSLFEKGQDVVCMSDGGSKLLEVGKVYKVKRGVGTCVFLGTTRDGWNGYDFARVIPKIDTREYKITFNQFVQTPSRSIRYAVIDRKEDCPIGVIEKNILTCKVTFTLLTAQWWLDAEQMSSLVEVMKVL